MNKYIYILIIFVIGCSKSDNPSQEDPNETEAIFYKGMDLSFQSELENYNIDYKDESGNPVQFLEFAKNKGTNLVRLRLWHTPEDEVNTLENVKAYAQQVKAKNMDFLLDFHYSDTWADPGNQTVPAAWQNFTFNWVKTALYDYTKNVVQQLKDQNTLPEIIQIGNETDGGFLWDYGKLWNEFDDNWPNYAELVREAIRAIKDVDTNNEIKIMLHHSNLQQAGLFFNELRTYNLDFDIIGLSYYPQFHTKDLILVRQKLNELAVTFDKDILMVEVAYPFTLNWNDNLNNFIGSIEQTLMEFPATPEGQKSYFEWLIQAIKSIPNSRGIGFCYWAPDWVAFPGNETTSSHGSAWENQCMFDFDHRALPVFDVYRAN